jgi:hypothetical protein
LWLAITRSPAARRRLRFPSPKSQCQRTPLGRPPFRGSSAKPAHAKPKPGACGPKPLGPGGRRGFYSRPLVMSTTFSRKKRISQRLQKAVEKQRDFAAPGKPRGPRERFGVATLLTYRFPSQASSTSVGQDLKISTARRERRASLSGACNWRFNRPQCAAMYACIAAASASTAAIRYFTRSPIEIIPISRSPSMTGR